MNGSVGAMTVWEPRASPSSWRFNSIRWETSARWFFTRTTCSQREFRWVSRYYASTVDSVKHNYLEASHRTLQRQKAHDINNVNRARWSVGEFPPSSATYTNRIKRVRAPPGCSKICFSPSLSRTRDSTWNNNKGATKNYQRRWRNYSGISSIVFKKLQRRLVSRKFNQNILRWEERINRNAWKNIFLKFFLWLCFWWKQQSQKKKKEKGRWT